MIRFRRKKRMFYIVTENGDFVGKYKDRDEAIAAYDALLHEDPLSHEECALIELDERGKRVGQPITAVHA